MSAPEIEESKRESSERRFLTIVFIDLVGYTALSEKLDPEDLRSLQRRYQHLAVETIESYGGFVAQFVGDGILVYFGYPQAHERDAERAVRATWRFLHLLPSMSTDLGGQTLPALDARAGIHSGLVVMGQDLLSAGTSAPGIVGEAVNLAARLQSQAAPGGILISQETLGLVEGAIRYDALGMRRIKGLAREVSVYQVLGILPGAARSASGVQRGATRMVGRDSSVEKILSLWEAAAHGDRCQTIAVVAEAGVGKTRLIHEVLSRPELADALVLQANCHEIFASTPLYPIASFLWARAGLAVEDTASESRLKVSRWLDEVAMNSEDNTAIVLSVLGMLGGGAESVSATPQALRRRQYQFIVAALEGLTRGPPTFLWIEDAHWLDPSSAELLHEIVAALKSRPVMVLLTMRSFPPGPALPKAEEVIYLEQMSDSDCLEIARSIPGAEILTPDLLQQAAKAAEGVPLFVEQLVLALLDERVPGRGGKHRPGALPLMLAEMLSERLDRLPGGRRIVQAAACIGRSFLPEFLSAVLQEEAAVVARPLEALAAAEILQPKRYGAEVRYEFRHALLQRMAYESMVQAERRALHNRIIDVLRLHAGPTPTLPEVMAHHLTEADRPLEAVEAWLQAGVTAGRRSAHVEAINHLRRGLALLPRVDAPDRLVQLELNLQVSIMGSVLATQSATSPEVHACCERGLQLCAQVGSSPLIFPFMFGEFTYANCRGRSEDAERLARTFLSLSERNAFESGRVIGHRMLGMALMTQGDAVRAREQIEASLSLYQAERDAPTTNMFGQNTEVHSKSLLSFILFCQGHVDAALRIGADALKTADALHHPHSTAIPLVYVGGWVFGLCDAADRMMMESRRLIRLAEQHRLAGFRAHGMGFFGWALCLRGEYAQGIAAIEQAVAAFEAVGFRLSHAGHLSNLADAQRRMGRHREAEMSSRRALEILPEGSQYLEPEVRRVAALTIGTNREETEEMLRHAVTRAQHLAFPVMERRCLSTLVTFIAPDRRDEAVDARLEALAHLANLDRRVDRTFRAFSDTV